MTIITIIYDNIGGPTCLLGGARLGGEMLAGARMTRHMGGPRGIG